MSLGRGSQGIQIAIVLINCSSNKLRNGDRDLPLSEHPLLDSKHSIGAAINPQPYTVIMSAILQM